MRPIIMVLLLGILFSLPLRAQDEASADAGAPAASPEENTQTTPEETADHYRVVVSVKRAEEEAFETNRSLSVVDRETLREKAFRSTPEALMETEGVMVQKTNHGGGSPILRGLIGPQVLVTVDGVRLNNSVYRTGPVQYLNLIDPLSLERIEVLKGPGSVLYGSDAMGGVIELVPLSPARFRKSDEFQYRANAHGRFASADLGATGHADGGIGVAGFGATAGVTYKNTRNLVAGGDPWGGLLPGVKKGEQPWSALDQVSAFSVTEYNLPGLKGWRIAVADMFSRIDDAGRTDRVLDKRGAIAASPSLMMYDNLDNLLWSRLSLRIDPIRTSGDITLSYQHFFERADARTLSVDDLRTATRITRNETMVDTVGVDARFESVAVPQWLTARYGAHFYHDMVGSRRDLDPTANGAWEKQTKTDYPDGSTYGNFGLYLLAESCLFENDGHVVAIEAGYRFHGFQGSAPAANDLPAVALDNYGHVFSAAVQYRHRDNTNVAFSFSQGFRAPNLQEAVMLGDTGKFFHIPNHDLDPEFSNTFELLLRQRVAPVTLAASAYISLIDDIIIRENATWEGATEVGGKPVAWNVNGGTARIYGLEGSTAIDLPGGLVLSLLGSYTRGFRKGVDGRYDNYTRIPPLLGQASLRWNAPEFARIASFLEVFVRGADWQDRLSDEDEGDTRIPEKGTPAWWTLNVRGGMRFFEDYRLTLSFENLLDRQYKYHASGVYEPGFNTVVALDASF